MAERGAITAHHNEMPADEWKFVKGLALGKDLKELADEIGWPLEKAQRLANSSRLLTAVATFGLQRVQSVYVPRALATVADIMNGSLKSPENGKIIPIKAETRLAAANTILKIARLEEHYPDPTAKDPLKDTKPEVLQELIGALQDRLADKAKPVNAQKDVVDAEVISELPSNYSVLD